MFASLPGDFEKQSAIVLGCNELLPYHPQALVDIVSALIERIPLVCVINGEDQRRHLVTLLCDWGLPVHLLHFVSLPVKGMWVRDYGPSFVRRHDRGITILDADYLEPDRRSDDEAPTELASLLRVPVQKVPITLEGGNILSNGQGLCLTTSTLVSRNVKRGYDEAAVRQILHQNYGFSEVMILHPLMSEPTGHIDMWATFVAPNVVVVGEYDPAIDPVNCDVLNHNARILSKIKTRWGPLQVVRIPMPSNRGGIWRTYTNVIYANSVVLMPTYARVDSEREQKAMDLYRGLLPGWDVVGVEATSIIHNRGALRCVSINIPWLDDRFGKPQARQSSPTQADALSVA